MSVQALRSTGTVPVPVNVDGISFSIEALERTAWSQ
jgi:hypothetical protein